MQQLGITVDFRAGIACLAIGRPIAGELVFISAERLVRMSSSEFSALARRRRQAPDALLRQILKTAAAAAQEVMNRETDADGVRDKVFQLLLQGEVMPGRGKELVFQTLI